MKQQVPIFAKSASPKESKTSSKRCVVMIPLGLPKDRKVSFVIPSMKIVVGLTDGE